MYRKGQLCVMWSCAFSALPLHFHQVSCAFPLFPGERPSSDVATVAGSTSELDTHSSKTTSETANISVRNTNNIARV